MVQVRYIRVWRGLKKMDVVFDEDGGRKRKVVFSWQSLDKGDVPPSHWLESAKGEVGFSDAERKRGFIPGM